VRVTCGAGGAGVLRGAEDADEGGIHDADGKSDDSGGVVGKVPGYVGKVP
jgi:hypothetical protein